MCKCWAILTGTSSPFYVDGINISKNITLERVNLSRPTSTIFMGKVIDRKIRVPICDAKISMSKVGFTACTLTNAMGEFALKLPSYGDYRVSISCCGYTPRTIACYPIWNRSDLDHIFYLS